MGKGGSWICLPFFLFLVAHAFSFTRKKWCQLQYPFLFTTTVSFSFQQCSRHSDVPQPAATENFEITSNNAITELKRKRKQHIKNKQRSLPSIAAASFVSGRKEGRLVKGKKNCNNKWSPTCREILGTENVLNSRHKQHLSQWPDISCCVNLATRIHSPPRCPLCIRRLLKSVVQPPERNAAPYRARASRKLLLLSQVSSVCLLRYRIAPAWNGDVISWLSNDIKDCLAARSRARRNLAKFI